jgi:hypothetical protein
MAPEILVLDEPTADLDGQGTEEVFAELGRLRRQGKTIVLVEHKLEEASQLADRIVVMEAGRVVADGPPRQVLGSRQPWLEDLDLPDVVRLGLTPPPLTADEAIALLMLPLVIGSMRRARQLALAAEVRAYRGERTSVNELRFTGIDWGVIGLAACVVAAGVLAMIGGYGAKTAGVR